MEYNSFRCRYKEEKSSLLKKTAKIEVTTINDVQNYIKETISEILKLMGQRLLCILIQVELIHMERQRVM